MSELMGAVGSLWYPAFALLMLGIAVIFMPRKQIRLLFIESLILGFVFHVLFGFLMFLVKVFYYRETGAFNFLHVPVWLALAWSPSIALYLYFRPPMAERLLFGMYLASFSLLSAVLDHVFHELGLLVYVHWSPAARFIVAALWFAAVAFLDERYARHRERFVDLEFR